MKRLLSIFIALMLFAVSFSANAVSTLGTKNITADNNRLFEIPVIVKSPKALTAATFTLKYDKSAAAFRKTTAAFPEATVKSVEKNGSVKVIFLCPNGVKVSKNSQLFSVTFKTLKQGSSFINITASDFVDSKAKNFTPPSSVKCRVSVNEKGEASAKSAKGGGVSADGYVYSDNSTEEVTKSSKKDDNSGSEKGGDLSDYENVLGSTKISPYFIVCLILASSLLTAGVMYFLTRKKKNNKDDKNNKE